MKRSIRRHQQRVAKLRHIRIVWRHTTWHWLGWGNQAAGGWQTSEKPWQAVYRCSMGGEPKWWQKERNLQPSRIRQNRLLHAIERGMNPDAVRRWPDYRKRGPCNIVPAALHAPVAEPELPADELQAESHYLREEEQ